MVLWHLAPDLAIIVLGYLLRGLLRPDGWQQIDKLCFYLLYPALLFGAASQRPIEGSQVLLFGSLGCAVVTLGFALTLIVRRLSGSTRSADTSDNDAGTMQNGWRFNTALGFVAAGAFTQHASEVTAALAIVVGLGIPLANIYAIVLLTKGQALSRLNLTREVILNPFLLASVAGIGVAVSGKTMPAHVSSLIERLANTAIPIVLLSLGAALASTRLWPPPRLALPIHAIKLLVLPLLVWAAFALLGVTGITAATVLVFSALPTASAAHLLAARYGGDRNQVAMVVMQSTALSLLSLPLWTSLATRLI